MVSALVDRAEWHNARRWQLVVAENLVGDGYSSHSSIRLDGLLFIDLALTDAAKRLIGASRATNGGYGKIKFLVNKKTGANFNFWGV